MKKTALVKDIICVGIAGIVMLSTPATAYAQADASIIESGMNDESIEEKLSEEVRKTMNNTYNDKNQSDGKEIEKKDETSSEMNNDNPESESTESNSEDENPTKDDTGPRDLEKEKGSLIAETKILNEIQEEIRSEDNSGKESTDTSAEEKKEDPEDYNIADNMEEEGASEIKHLNESEAASAITDTENGAVIETWNVGGADSTGFYYVTSSESEGTSDIVATLYENGIMKVEGNGSMLNWRDKDTRPWAEYSSDIGAVVIGDGIDNIGGYAFMDCDNLVTVEIPDSIKVIGDCAFYGCEKMDIKGDLPSGMEKICGRAFKECKELTNIQTLPQNIQFAAFMGCEYLSEIELNEDMTIINNQVFSGCKNLKLKAIPSKVTLICEDSFYGCESLGLESMGNSVRSIGGNCFKGAKVNITSLPETLTHIGDNAYEGSIGLELESLPEALVTIDAYAFKDCTGLKLKKLPEGIKRIETGSFMGCTGLELTELPEGLEAVDLYAFKGCSGLKITEFPASLSYVAHEAFKDCDGVIISHLPSDEMTIGEKSFYVEYEEKAYLNEEKEESFLGTSIHRAYYGDSVITELNEAILPDGLSEDSYYPSMIFNKEEDDLKKARVDAAGNRTSVVTIYNNEGSFRVRFFNTLNNEEGILVHEIWADKEGHIKPYTFTEYDPDGNKQMMGWTKERGKYDVVDISGTGAYVFTEDTDLYTYWGTGDLIYDLEIDGYFGTGFRWNYNPEGEIEITENRSYQELVFICTDKDKSGTLNNPTGSFSFDGGNTWSDKREMIIWENGIYEIVVRDYHNHAKRFKYEVNNLVDGLKEKETDIRTSYPEPDDSRDEIGITQSITKEDAGKKNIYFNPNNGAKTIEFIAPIKGVYSIKALGAAGGTAVSPIGEKFKGGNGGSVEGKVYLEAGESLSIKIGGKGEDVMSAVYERDRNIPEMIGGYPDGGNANLAVFGSSQYGDMYIIENAPGGGSTSIAYKGGTIINAAGGAGGGVPMHSEKDARYIVHDSSDTWENIVPTTEKGGGGGYERGFICSTRKTSDVYAGHSFADDFYIINPVKTADVNTEDGGGMAEITFEGSVVDTYTISFMDGDTEVAKKTYKANEKCSLPEYPEKPGYVPEGWFKLDDPDDRSNPSSFDRKKLLKDGAVVNEDITVYVLWKKKTAYVVNLPLELRMEESEGKIFETDIDITGSVTDYNIRKDTRIKENFISVDVEDSSYLTGKYFGETVATTNTIEPLKIMVNSSDNWSDEDNAYISTYDLATKAHIRSERVFTTDRYSGEVAFDIGSGDITYVVSDPDSMIEDTFVIIMPDEPDQDKKGSADLRIRDIDEAYGQVEAGITISDKILKDPKLRILRDGRDVTEDFDIRISIFKGNPVSVTFKTRLYKDDNGNNTYRLPAGAYKVILSGVWNSNEASGREDAANDTFEISSKDTGFWVKATERDYDEASRKYTYDFESSTYITNLAAESVTDSEGKHICGFRVNEVLKEVSGNKTVETFDVTYPENLPAGKYKLTFGGMKYDFDGRTWSAGYEDDLFSIEIDIRYPEGKADLTLKDVNIDKGILKLGVTSNRDIENETVKITFDGADVTDEFEISKSYLLGSVNAITFETRKEPAGSMAGDGDHSLKEGVYSVYLGGRFKGDLYDTDIMDVFILRIQLPDKGSDDEPGNVTIKRVKLQEPVPDKWSMDGFYIYFDADPQIMGLRIRGTDDTGKDVSGCFTLSGSTASNRYRIDVYAENLSVGNYTIILDALHEGDQDNWLENAYSIGISVVEEAL